MCDKEDQRFEIFTELMKNIRKYVGFPVDDKRDLLYADFSCYHLVQSKHVQDRIDFIGFSENQLRPQAPDDRMPWESYGIEGPKTYEETILAHELRIMHQWLDLVEDDARRLRATHGLSETAVEAILVIIKKAHSSLIDIVVGAYSRARAWAASGAPTRSELLRCSALVRSWSLAKNREGREHLEELDLSPQEARSAAAVLEAVAEKIGEWRSRRSKAQEIAVDREWEKLWKDPGPRALTPIIDAAEKIYHHVAAKVLDDNTIVNMDEFEEARQQIKQQVLEEADTSGPVPSGQLRTATIKRVRKEGPLPLRKDAAQPVASLLNVAFANFRVDYNFNSLQQALRKRREREAEV